MKNKEHIFCKNDFLVTSILEPLYLLKSCTIFSKAAKLCKVSQDAYNQGGWLILKDLLNDWFAKGVVPEVHDIAVLFPVLAGEQKLKISNFSKLHAGYSQDKLF